MLVLYPAIKPYRQHSIAVDDLHTVYIEECGNPDGLPVLVVHGGPGSGCNRDMRRFFDPELYRIILFDQRGSGRSTPHAELKDNNTGKLLEDMEQIRHELGVDQWLLFGGSWGATLSLLYAQKHPDLVKGMILRGTFLCRQEDLDWLYRDGANRVFPDKWKALFDLIPDNEREDILTAYHRLLNGENDLLRMSAAKAWASWEAHCSTLSTCNKLMNSFNDPHLALSMARMETHYFVNKGFIEENQILDNMDKISQVPAIIVHGRYDMVCPLENAYALHQKWVSSQLRVIREAGHSSTDQGIIDALIHATQDMADRFQASAS